MKRNEKGFTLIELLIVVIILGILAVIGIPKFMNSKAAAIVKACQTNRSSLEDAGERYHFDCGAYPALVSGSEQTNLAASSAPTGLTGWNGPYIKVAFTCPLTSEDSYTFDDTTGVVACSNADGTTAIASSALSGVASGKHAYAIKND
jgi:type II secretion system protein G